ncbi:MAG: rhodanese-like domain-containing protein [Candidatus Latescibacterota bacterium]|nr:MAG: rhodanese-like domain-containing protein [Candidatus Latescibacterota bacterium]
MNWKPLAAAVMLAAALVLMIVGQPDLDRKLAWAASDLDEAIASRNYHIDPAELLELMWNNQLRLALLDVRDEGDYNLFHLIDSRWFAFTEEDLLWSAGLPGETVRVVLSNDETAANEAWKKLKVLGVPNIYILSGGINVWLSLCKPHKSPTVEMVPPHILKPNASALGDDKLKYTFPAALGDRYPEARPPATCFADREFTSKVEVLKPAAVLSGGCGG